MINAIRIGVGEDVIIPFANSIQSENKSNWPDAKEILLGIVIGFEGVEGADTTALSELLAGQNTSGDIYCDQLKPIFYEIANIFEAVIG